MGDERLTRARHGIEILLRRECACASELGLCYAHATRTAETGTRIAHQTRDCVWRLPLEQVHVRFLWMQQAQR